MMKKKLRNKKGFTLAEMLIAMLITSMAGMIALGGIVVAANAYHDILMKNQSQLVMKEYMDAIRSTLSEVSAGSGFEIYEETRSDGTVRVYFPNSRAGSAGYFKTENVNKATASNAEQYEVIVFQHVSTERSTDPNAQAYPDITGQQSDLIEKRTAKGFKAELTEFSYSADQGFKGKIKLTANSRLSTGGTLELTQDFQVYPLNYRK